MLLNRSVFFDSNSHWLRRRTSSFLLIINYIPLVPYLALTGRSRNNRTSWLPTAIYANSRSTEISNKQEEIAYVLGWHKNTDTWTTIRVRITVVCMNVNITSRTLFPNTVWKLHSLHCFRNLEATFLFFLPSSEQCTVVLIMMRWNI